MNTYIYIKLFSVCLCFLAAISAIYVCDVFIFRPPILYILPLFKEYIFRPPPPHSYAESIFINQILLLVHRLQKGEVYFCSVSLLFCYVPQNSSNLPVTRGLVITVSNNSLSLLLFLE